MTINNLRKIIEKYLSEKDQASINRAYEFALKAHGQQKRGTGEPWIIHPLTAAITLAQDHLDGPTIAASLLHDVQEDTNYTNKDIENEFGKEIACLVEGVTKLDKIKIQKNWFTSINFLQNQEKRIKYEHHVECLRKMLMAMTKDIRIIFIKLADRLHNMKTLEGVRPDKRLRIARETLEIYAPIAYRLGMGKLKGELQDLAFLYVFPKEYEITKKLAGTEYHNKEKYYLEAQRIIEKQLLDNHIEAKIDGRKKHLYSLWLKLKKYEMDIEKIYDIIALRIIVNSTEDCYKVLGMIHSIWKPLIGRIKDYIALPKPNGYRSLHTTVFGPDGEIIEIQIRTREMHRINENGVAAHWYYSEKKNSQFLPQDQLDWLKELANWQEKNQKEWYRGLSLDFFHKRIYAFTPQGDVIDLPADATPIDFAYSIHTDVGNKCGGAKVNGRIVKLNHILDNGDIVEIITNQKSKGPKRDWLRFAKTQRAISKIKSQISNGLILGK